MLKILKASAGSGKTYNLAREYIRLLVVSDKPDAYRHVLAVTFTNKATEEMKRRILKELHLLATAPDKSPYHDDFVPALVPDDQALQARALQQLSGILHDYSSFAVSTIDRFFQQTLRAFSREVGQFSSYQVQLDREALVTESVDRLLDSLTETDTALLDWLTRGVRQQLDQTGRFSIEGRLQEMASSIQDMPQRSLVFPRERLLETHRRCSELAEDFRRQVKQAAQAVLDCFDSVGVSPLDTTRSFMKVMPAYASLGPKDAIVPPTAAFLRNAADPEAWFPKTKANLRPLLEGRLEALLKAFTDLFGTPYQVYMTAQVIRSQVYSLGLAGELKNAMVALQRENNVLSLDDANVLLRDIIDGTDAPFIYEKLGVRYEDFLLDEFQDTSDIQWQNFRPLLHESQASGHDSLVVGDVKQSIYRWRGSDWNLLDSRLEADFGSRQSHVSVLDGNYRTCAEIVRFNNDFFTYAARQLGLSNLYADVVQQVRFPDPAPGSVDVVFKENAEAQMTEVLDSLAAFHEAGGQWADAAVLVRGNAEGAAVAQALVAAGIPVVSDDSLFIKSSVTVRRLVSQLSLLNRPDTQDERPSAAGFLARSLDVPVSESFHSLVDLAERLLASLHEADPQVFDSEIPYIQSFMDYLLDWTGSGGNNLGAFLRQWEEADPKIASPQTGTSVRVMTIHKSKGLEFPFVLLPFAEKIGLYKAPDRWCTPAVEGTPLEGVAEDLYRVCLDEKSAASLFAGDYQTERHLQAVDALNVLYVAMTRAKYGLKVLATAPAQALVKALEKGQEPNWTDMSQLLFAHVGRQDYHAGVPYPPDRLAQPGATAQLMPAAYPVAAGDGNERLRFSPEAADYFGGDGSYGPDASARIRGNVLHGILSAVERAEDVDAAVQDAVRSGLLSGKDRDHTRVFLAGRIDAVRQAHGWFGPKARVFREAALIAPDGREYRPDRVEVLPDGRVTVIDFKFGKPAETYLRQVRRYVQLYRQMGYERVEGFLWYLQEEENAVVPVK